MIEVLHKTFENIPINFKEVSRYYNGKILDLNNEDKTLLNEYKDIFNFNVLYTILPKKNIENGICLADYNFISKDLSFNLRNCDKVILFIASVGLNVDREIKKFSLVSPQKALLINAFGTERVESLCDTFVCFCEKEYGKTAPRFSAGYGDLNLSAQKDIFSILLPKKIGVSLNDNLIMSPSKTVTAFMGLCNDKNYDFNKCNLCKKDNCEFRIK